MILYGAPGDTASTWGISGPSFLRIYLAVSAVVLIGTLLYRRQLFGGRATPPARLSPQAVAYLNGGAKLAIYACLGGLRTAGAIGVQADRRLRQTGPLPAGATALDQAVYNAVGGRVRARELAGHEWVKTAIGTLREELERDGLVATAERRRAYRGCLLLMVGLVALGVARLVAGIANDKPVGYLALALIFMVLATVVLFLHTARRTTAGETALLRLRADHRYLAPAQRPSWRTYGAADAGMGIALFGTAALWAADPAFAAASEVQRQYASASGSGSAGYYAAGAGSGGYDGGGGSSCGGGGGCGGGGCGG
jgi:uncharacterized protein (TIGR04222 family)